MNRCYKETDQSVFEVSNQNYIAMVKHQPSDVRRAQIIQAAVEVCADKGYHASRIDDIAARAGLSKGAVYHHFASKQEVFLGVMEMIMDEATSYIEELDEAGAGARETMQKTLEMLLDMFREQPKFLRGIFELFFLSARDPEFRERAVGYYDSMIEVTTRVIRHGIERGEIDDSVDPEAASRVFVMGGDGLMLILLLLEQPELVEESVRLQADLLFAGMVRKSAEGSNR